MKLKSETLEKIRNSGTLHELTVYNEKPIAGGNVLYTLTNPDPNSPVQLPKRFQSFQWLPTWDKPDWAKGRIYYFTTLASDVMLNNVKFDTHNKIRCAGSIVNTPLNLDHEIYDLDGFNVVLDAEVEGNRMEGIVYVESVLVNDTYDAGDVIGCSIDYFDRNVTAYNRDFTADGVWCVGLAFVTKSYLCGDPTSRVWQATGHDPMVRDIPRLQAKGLAITVEDMKKKLATAEDAKAEFGISDEDWNALTDDEKAAKIAEVEDNEDDDDDDDDSDSQTLHQLAGTPKTDEERAMAHFELSEDDWSALSDDEKAAKISELPELGSGRERVFTEAHKLTVDIRMLQFEEEGAAEPTTEERVTWLEEDIRTLFNNLWTLEEKYFTRIDAVEKRIDDVVILLSGQTVEHSVVKTNDLVRSLAYVEKPSELYDSIEAELRRRLDLGALGAHNPHDNGQQGGHDDGLTDVNELYKLSELENRVGCLAQNLDGVITTVEGLRALANPEDPKEEPDEHFAFIEGGGTLDEHGLTAPRELRHLQFKTLADGHCPILVQRSTEELKELIMDGAIAAHSATSAKALLLMAHKALDIEYPDWLEVGVGTETKDPAITARLRRLGRRRMFSSRRYSPLQGVEG